ncbi:hypothetical protein DCC85_12610 [Paenibacillus sp. CAA11]|uniref:tetratricopeptide repeat protein n=1 Tax=Paenibacillus sp. CAA11 TaxID=1532905 RepID=UPI000D33FA27|nr:tetratricopeptide repeat protein [Paenibacillus sp. CAA11]AWB44978.1 hypothetical protein DCC85_12610 [Paenibacillus sp. CAA11]
MMFQHVFAEMNEILDEIALNYPAAEGHQKQELSRKWRLLKHMSDGIIEEWLTLEEKMGEIQQKWKPEEAASDLQAAELDSTAFVKGQGYYQLQMFTDAVKQFEEAVQRYPSSVLARLYLAMSLLNLAEFLEAAGHFEEVLQTTPNKRIRSICCNALGCIEAMGGRTDLAKAMFMTAYRLDPSLPEPLHNLEACLTDQGIYRFESELASLI